MIRGKDQRTVYRPGVGGVAPERVVEFDLPPGDVFAAPSAPPRGGRFFVASVWSRTTLTMTLHRFDLETGEVRPLVSDAHMARVFDAGRLAFRRDDGTLWVAPLDLERGAR